MIVNVLALIWHSLVFLKIPHLTWIPAFIGTWFYERGLVYYKDFIQLHFLLPHLLAFPLLKLTNWDIRYEPILSYLVAATTSIIIYKLFKKIIGKTASGLAVIFFSIFFWYASTWVQYTGESVAGIFLLFLVSYLLKTAESRKIALRSSFILGLLFSLTELSGQIVTLTLVSLAAYFLYRLISSKTKVLKNTLYFCIGGVIPLAIFGVYFYLKGALKDYVFWNTGYYFTYANLASANRGLLPWRDILFLFSPAILSLFLLFKKKSLDKLTTIVTITLISSFPFVVGSIFHPHHYLFVLPVAAIAFGKAISLDKSRFLIGFSLYMLIFIFMPWYSYRLTHGPVNQNLNDVSKDPQVRQLVSNIKERSGAKRIIVVGDPLVYYFADTLPANKYFMALPWHYLPLEATKKTFDEKPPQLWIIDTAYLRRFYGSWKTPEVGDFIKSQVESCYSKVYESEPWEIWERVCQEN